jgi:ferredoxin
MDPGKDRIFQVTLRLPEAEHVVRVPSQESIWYAAADEGISLPAVCRQGRCLSCAGRLAAPGDFDQDGADLYFPEDRAAGFILLCTARPRSDLVIVTHQQDAMRAHRLAHGLPAPYT